jgi:hypothetical protein
MVRFLPLVAALAGAATLAPAQEPGSLTALVARSDDDAGAAKSFRGLRVEGPASYSAIREVVRGLDWLDELRDAQAEAAKLDRPIVWIHALGDLKGFT